MDRAEISRRLKAARWLAGGLDEKGRPAPLAPEALAQHEALQRNGITANAISEIERMVKDARPMELREIREALDLPQAWFTADRYQRIVDDPSDNLARIEDAVLETAGYLREVVGAVTAHEGAAHPQPPGELGRRLADGQPTHADRPREDTGPAAASQRELGG